MDKKPEVMYPSVAILFGDNDFYYTFIPLLRAIGEAMKVRREYPRDKETLLKIINESSFAYYIVNQCFFSYEDEKQHTFTKNYLQINSSQLLIGDEVAVYKRNADWNNSETFILEFINPDNTVYVYAL